MPRRPQTQRGQGVPPPMTTKRNPPTWDISRIAGTATTARHPRPPRAGQAVQGAVDRRGRPRTRSQLHQREGREATPQVGRTRRICEHHREADLETVLRAVVAHPGVGTGTVKKVDQAIDSVTFGDVQLDRLRPSHIQAWIKSMSDKPRPRTPFGPGSTMFVLSSVPPSPTGPSRST